MTHELLVVLIVITTYDFKKGGKVSHSTDFQGTVWWNISP